MTRTPLVSIIILNYNGADYLKECISSVLDSNYTYFEVIFVDNGSTDSSLKVIEPFLKKDSRIKIIRNRRNLGFAGGNNVAIPSARGKYIMLLNNDTVVDSNWLSSLIDILSQDQSIGVAQSLLLEINGKRIQIGGALYTDYLMETPVIGKGKPSETKLPSTFEVSYACGAAIAVDKELINKAGLFDPAIPFYYDDTLLGFKAWLTGKRVVTVSASRVCHFRGASTANLENQVSFAVLNTLRARVSITLDVYYDFRALAKALFLLILQVFQSCAFFIKQRQIIVVLAHAKGLKWALCNFRHIWRNRLGHWGIAEIPPYMLLEKFIRIKLHSSALYLLPEGYRKKHIEKALKEYEARNLS